MKPDTFSNFSYIFRVFFAITFCGMTVSWATAYFPDFVKARFSAALIFKMIKEKPNIDNMSTGGDKIVSVMVSQH